MSRRARTALIVIVVFVGLTSDLGWKQIQGAGTCPEGFSEQILQHSVASNLTINANDISRGSVICVDKASTDDKKKNATGRSFQRAWKDGKFLAIPEEAFYSELPPLTNPFTDPPTKPSLPSQPFEERSSNKPQALRKIPGQHDTVGGACLVEPGDSQASTTAQTPIDLPATDPADPANDDDGAAGDRLIRPDQNGTPSREPKLLAIADSTEEAARLLTHQALLTSILEAHKSLERAAKDDNKIAGSLYSKLPLEALGKHLKQAQDNLDQGIQALSLATAGLDESEIMRFKNIYLNARDKAALGYGAIAQEESNQKTLGHISPFSGLLRSSDDLNPLARTRELGDIFASQNALSTDSLINRLVMFNGLGKKDQADLLPKLKLAEKTKLRLSNGKTETLTLLHNGYIFGASSSGVDCSSLVSAALPPDVRKGRLTTLDFRAMWIYLRTGILPIPPRYSKDRSSIIRDTAHAFVAINIYAGERLVTGDILVHRLPWDTAGHVFVIRTFDHHALNTEVIEAAQSAGTIRERSFALSTDPPSDPSRLLRAGLFALRLKPLSNRACQYKKKENKTPWSG